MASAQLEGELAAVLDVIAFQDVGVQLEPVVVHDQPGVAVDRHQERVARTGHQHVELSARLAWAVAAGESPEDPRLLGNALADGRQRARLHLLEQRWGFLHRRYWGGGELRAHQHAEADDGRDNAPAHANLGRYAPG